LEIDFGRRLHRQLYTGHAVIRLSGDGVRRMRHLLSAEAVTAVETAGTADADGWLRTRVPIESADHALADFLRLGADIEIVEPASLREQAARTIQAMAAIYNQPESLHAGRRQMAGRDCVRHGTVGVLFEERGRRGGRVAAGPRR